MSTNPPRAGLIRLRIKKSRILHVPAEYSQSWSGDDRVITGIFERLESVSSLAAGVRSEAPKLIMPSGLGYRVGPGRAPVDPLWGTGIHGPVLRRRPGSPGRPPGAGGGRLPPGPAGHSARCPGGRAIKEGGHNCTLAGTLIESAFLTSL